MNKSLFIGLVFILFTSLASADLSDDVEYYYLFDGNVKYGSGSDNMSVENTKELIQEYCTAIHHRLVVWLCIAAFMWLIQPKVYAAIDKIRYQNPIIEEMFGGNNLKIMYKWLGIGILFIIGYAIIIM